MSARQGQENGIRRLPPSRALIFILNLPTKLNRDCIFPALKGQESIAQALTWVYISNGPAPSASGRDRISWLTQLKPGLCSLAPSGRRIPFG